MMKVLSFCLGMMFGIVVLGTSVEGQTPGKKTPLGGHHVKTGVDVSWHLMFHSLDWGVRLARDLLLHESTLSLSSVAHRSRVQWNARGIAQFCKAYQYYITQLSQHFSAHPTVWAQWKSRIQQIERVAKTLQEDALEGKQDRDWKPLRQSLQTWPLLALPVLAKPLSKKAQEVVWGTISGLSTGIEFTGFHTLVMLYQKILSTKMSTKPVQLVQFLRDIHTHRLKFRELRRSQPKATWIPLFIYHAELLYRATIFLGRSVASKPTQRSMYATKYQKYMEILEKSLKKENSSFADFWRK